MRAVGECWQHSRRSQFGTQFPLGQRKVAGQFVRKIAFPCSRILRYIRVRKPKQDNLGAAPSKFQQSLPNHIAMPGAFGRSAAIPSDREH